jgi:hypothetical protein
MKYNGDRVDPDWDELQDQLDADQAGHLAKIFEAAKPKMQFLEQLPTISDPGDEQPGCSILNSYIMIDVSAIPDKFSTENLYYDLMSRGIMLIDCSNLKKTNHEDH